MALSTNPPQLQDISSSKAVLYRTMAKTMRRLSSFWPFHFDHSKVTVSRFYHLARKKPVPLCRLTNQFSRILIGYNTSYFYGSKATKGIFYIYILSYRKYRLQQLSLYKKEYLMEQVYDEFQKNKYGRCPLMAFRNICIELTK